jgi:hypothetical protein
MHRAGARVAWHRKTIEYLATASHTPQRWLIQERRTSTRETSYEEVSPSVLGEPAELATVVSPLVEDVALSSKEPLDSTKEPSAPRCDSRNILQQDERRPFVPSFENELEPSSYEAIQSLILRTTSRPLRDQPREPLTRWTGKDHIGHLRAYE